MDETELLTVEQAARVIANAVRARERNGGGGVSEAELARLLEFVEGLVRDAAYLRLILSGDIAFDPTGDDPDEWPIVSLAERPA